MFRKSLVAYAVSMVSAGLVLAHFPFIVPDSSGATAKIIMSETLEQDKEVKISTLAGMKLSVRSKDGKDTPLSATPSNDYSMSLAIPGSNTRVIHGIADLGVVQRGQGKPHHLVYYPKTIVGDSLDSKTVVGNSAPIELVPVKSENGFKLELRVNQKPVAADREITIIHSDDKEEIVKTDASGQSPELKENGLYGAWARNWIDETAELDGKKYEQVREYATIVFHQGMPNASSGSDPDQTGLIVKSIATLKQPVASFGAVEMDGYLYTYGGHIAERHDYSTASVSGKFARMNIQKPGEWESLPDGAPVQGMNIAAHNGKIYRVGGMQPRNAPGTEADNHSIAEVASFDPKEGKWQQLPPLNVARSSHDIAFIGNKLYVVGGWSMKGKDGQDEWLSTMEVLDLDAKELKWEVQPQPFNRRALVTTVYQDKLLVFGGFDSDDKAQLDVDVLDTKTGTWSKIAPIPGKQMNGFSPAACTIAGSVYLSVGSGDLYKLAPNMQSWTRIAKANPRIVHRLVAYKNQILIVGGASGPRMMDQIESVELSAAQQ